MSRMDTRGSREPMPGSWSVWGDRLETLQREHRQQPDSVVRGVSDKVEQLELVR